MHWRLCVGIMMHVIAGTPAVAQADLEDQLRNSLGAHVYDIELTDDGVHGEGAAFLIERAAESEFLLIGETHGTLETPLFTQHMLDALHPHGYSVYAIETGPIVTRDLVEHAHRDGETAVSAMLLEYPLTAAFLFFDADRTVFNHAVTTGWDVWGLDQEFIVAARYLLQQLVDIAPSAAARAIASDHAEKAQRGFDAFMMSGDQAGCFIPSVTTTELDQLDELFEGGPPRAQHILRELRATTKVYGHFFAGRQFENNRDRVRLMKQHLVDELNRVDGAGDPAPKIVFRFGSSHMGRGFSPFDQLDLGNQAAELATLRGGESFHVLVLALARVTPDGQMDDLTASQPALRLILDQGDQTQAKVIDLEPSRALLSSKEMREAFPAVHDLARRYDAVVVLPTFHDSPSITPLPTR